MIEISFQYHTLFKLAIQHNFYAEQKSNDFRLVATAPSQSLAKKLGLILKEADGGYCLLYEKEKLEGMLSHLETSYPVKFSFLLYCTNPYFINFTDIPVETGSDILYFSNNKANKVNESYLLQKQDIVNKSDYTRLIPYLEIAAEGTEKKIDLKDDDGKIVFSSVIKGQERIQIDNKKLPIGWYELYENGKLKNSFVLLSDIPVQRPIALIDIFLSGAIKNEVVEGIKDFELPLYDYKIQFGARSTFWKYLLISKYNNNLKNTVINSGGNEVKFKGPSEIKMRNGMDALEFVSETPLTLKERPDYRFQLKSVKAGASNGKTIMDKLPLASPETIRPESRNEDSKIFSEIIVYI